MQRSAFCRSRRELYPNSNAYFLAKFGFDTAENEPFQVCPLSVYRSPRCNTQPCPVDCIFSDWLDWGDCSEWCYLSHRPEPERRNGIRYRNRTILQQAAHGGEECGDPDEAEICEGLPDCPTPEPTPKP